MGSDYLTVSVTVKSKKVGRFNELTIDMEEKFNKALTGIKAIDEPLFQKHVDARFVSFSLAYIQA